MFQRENTEVWISSMLFWGVRGRFLERYEDNYFDGSEYVSWMGCKVISGKFHPIAKSCNAQ